MEYLNLGCGSRFHADWTNVDVKPSNSAIIRHDLREGIPYLDSSFDLVYHSHLLEHFPRDYALEFTRECFRVLRQGGLVRVVVPDLEQIARAYLQSLKKSLAGGDGWANNLEWMVLELYDQAVRERSGGDMAEYLGQHTVPNKDFVIGRWGTEARKYIERDRSTASQDIHASVKEDSRDSGLETPFQRIYAKLTRRLLGEADFQALQIGRFRMGGEVHFWMYDRFSLARLMELAGFEDPIQRTASESGIENWARFNLDAEPNGRVYKPDSLYMEAVKKG